MRRTVARSGVRRLVPALGLGLAVHLTLLLALLLGPASAFADEPVTGAAVSGAAVSGVGMAAGGPSAAGTEPATEPGPALPLLVAGVLGLLGALSGPEVGPPARRSDLDPRGRSPH